MEKTSPLSNNAICKDSRREDEVLSALGVAQSERAEEELIHRLRQARLSVGQPSVATNNSGSLPDQLLQVLRATDLADAEWLRLPAPRARCRLTGLSRTTLNELIEQRAIRAITVRQPGATRGIKLMLKSSLIAYLCQLDRDQNGQAPTGSEADVKD